MRHLCRRYDALNAARPLATKATTCGVLYGASDLLTQNLEQRCEPASSTSGAPLDAARFVRMAEIGRAHV